MMSGDGYTLFAGEWDAGRIRHAVLAAVAQSRGPIKSRALGDQEVATGVEHILVGALRMEAVVADSEHNGNPARRIA